MSEASTRGRPRKSYIERKAQLLAERNEELRSLAAQGMGFAALGRKFGITRQRAEQIVKGRTTRSGVSIERTWQFRCLAWRERGRSARYISRKVGVPIEDVCALLGIEVPPLPPGQKEKENG